MACGRGSAHLRLAAQVIGAPALPSVLSNARQRVSDPRRNGRSEVSLSGSTLWLHKIVDTECADGMRAGSGDPRPNAASHRCSGFAIRAIQRSARVSDPARNARPEVSLSGYLTLWFHKIVYERNVRMACGRGRRPLPQRKSIGCSGFAIRAIQRSRVSDLAETADEGLSLGGFTLWLHKIVERNVRCTCVVA